MKTIAHLIEELEKVEDKSKEVWLFNSDNEMRPGFKMQVFPDWIEIYSED